MNHQHTIGAYALREKPTITMTPGGVYHFEEMRHILAMSRERLSAPEVLAKPPNPMPRVSALMREHRIAYASASNGAAVVREADDE